MPLQRGESEFAAIALTANNPVAVAPDPLRTVHRNLQRATPIFFEKRTVLPRSLCDETPSTVFMIRPSSDPLFTPFVTVPHFPFALRLLVAVPLRACSVILIPVMIPIPSDPH